MSTLTPEEMRFIVKMQVRLGKEYTDEQVDFFHDFTSPVLSFSDPGTGKSTAVVAGLLKAELFDRIPGNMIYASSFTRNATKELQQSHKRACKKLGLSNQTINFQTIHSLCYSILERNAEKLKMKGLNPGENTITTERICSFLLGKAQDNNISLTDRNVGKVKKAIESLNSALIFDESHIISKKIFIDTGVSYEDFTFLRKSLYKFYKILKVVPRGDILLYTLELLMTFPEIAEEFRKSCKIFVVDEVQDVSLLQLKLISLLADNCIAIGDIKQQIYLFNGACEEVVSKYKEYYPNYKEKNLTKSFRCSDAIVRYSLNGIGYNDLHEINFTGTGEEGSVEQRKGTGYDDIIEHIATIYRENRGYLPEDIMFLFRNNQSYVPLVEKLFQRGIPFRIHNFKRTYEMELICDMVKFVELARDPYTSENVHILRKWIPELKEYTYIQDNPLYKIMEMEQCDVFQVKYKFNDMQLASKVFDILFQTRDMSFNENIKVSEIFNLIYPIYNKYYVSWYQNYLENPPAYYFKLVDEICRMKNYETFITDENKKEEIVNKANRIGEGVRCYTFHSAKGLEADWVVAIDADSGIIPNERKIEEQVKNNCTLDAARDIRSERNLVFVAITRAKKKLTVCYNSELSSLFTTNNIYENFDKIYKNATFEYKDVEAFLEFARR